MNMESFALTVQSKEKIACYLADNFLMKHEAKVLNDVILAIDRNDNDQLTWFAQFGNDIRHMMMNVHAYSKQQEFGFTAIAFDQYNWLSRPTFMEIEDIILGNGNRYNEHSVIHLGRGVNHIWTYALNYTFGTAGGGSALSVYGKQFPNREAALTYAVTELKTMMSAKVGNTDTTNYKQAVILDTLRSIGRLEVSRVQLTLF
jgi:hypothetical protein